MEEYNCFIDREGKVYELSDILPCTRAIVLSEPRRYFEVEWDDPHIVKEIKAHRREV